MCIPSDEVSQPRKPYSPEARGNQGVISEPLRDPPRSPTTETLHPCFRAKGGPQPHNMKCHECLQVSLLLQVPSTRKLQLSEVLDTVATALKPLPSPKHHEWHHICWLAPPASTRSHVRMKSPLSPSCCQPPGPHLPCTPLPLKCKSHSPCSQLLENSQEPLPDCVTIFTASLGLYIFA